MTENEFTFWAFLSYSEQDNGEQRPDAADAGNLCCGNWLHDELKTYSLPAALVGQVNARGEIIPERIDPIFQDLEEQPGDSNLSEHVRQTLEQSRCLVVICSPRSAKSLHVNEVVRYFKQLGRSNRILPIVVAGAPNVSDGHKPGVSLDDECFVPALRHPVNPDGTLDTARRDRGIIFADARQGDANREMLATDFQTGKIKLETAKIQLIAGLLGVGFNGLWEQELKRCFIEAKLQASKGRQPIQETQNLDPEVQSRILAAQNQASEAQQHVRELRNQAQEAQSKLLEAQNQAREALGQLAEVRHQAQTAESKTQEAQTRLEEARHQVREAQSKILEIQNSPQGLPQDVKSQIEAAQAQAREAQTRIEAARHQAQQTQSELATARQEAHITQNGLLEAQNQVREALSQVQQTEHQARQVRSQLELAQNQVQAAESKVLEAQQQAREVQKQLEETRNQVREAQAIIQETQNQMRAAQSQAEEARNKARVLENQFLETQSQARVAQTQVRESQAARRLTKVLAVMAVLALMAAASLALWQQKKITEARAKVPPVLANEPDLAAGKLNREQIQRALQNCAGGGQGENLSRGLDELATRIPPEEISETLNAAAVILTNSQSSRFQEHLLDCWIKANSSAAFDWGCRLTNVDFRRRAIEQIIPALAAENFTNTLARLNGLKPPLDERSYTLLFQRWATQDPVQAIKSRQQIPGQDADSRILSAIMTVWADQQPTAALNWFESQSDSEFLPTGIWRNMMLAGLFHDWAAKDLEAATAACRQLPDNTAKEKAWESVLSQQIVKAPASAAESVKNLSLGDFRQKAISELCKHWVGPTNIPAVLVWVQSLPLETERTAALNQVIANLARKDPQAASQFAIQHPELSVATVVEIATVWSQSDFTATTNWVASLPEEEKKTAVLLALVETWSQSDPKGMAAYALGLPAGDLQTRYLTAACRQLAVHDFPATVELLQPLSDVALRLRVLEQAAESCDPSHLNEAAKYIAVMPADADQKSAIKGLVSSWASADPETAINWLSSFPETNSQPELVRSIIKAWSQPEPSVVAKWLANLPAGIASDGAISAFLEGALVKYPEYAAQWTQSVTDETKREKYEILVARQWMKTNALAATKWIEKLSLPEETKSPLKGSLPNTLP